MKKITKRIMVVLIVLCCIFIQACSTHKNTTTTTIEVPVITTEEELINELQQLDGVSEVTKITDTTSFAPNENAIVSCMITFNQPIDWDNPSLGTFPQKVRLAFVSQEQINAFYVGGYMLYDIYGQSDATELSRHYNANYIDIEYRFYGESIPEGLSISNEKYWQYLTSDNASRDFHHIITQMKRILPSTSIFYGISKGGYATEYMASCYPDDIEAYVSYVAPLCEGLEDPRMYKNVFETIGDDVYGTEEAARKRSIVIKFMKLLLDEQYRTDFQNAFLDAYTQSGYELSTLATADEAYEVSVVEGSLSIFQYNMNIDKLNEIVEMPEDTPDQISQKKDKLMELYLSLDPVMVTAWNCPFSPFYVQEYLEMGCYSYDFSYLRKAGANIKTSEENDASLARRLGAPEMENWSISYDASYRQRLIDYFSKTDKEIIKIDGLNDIWYAVSMPELNNPNIHRYGGVEAHNTSISSLDEESQKECYSIIDRLLGVKGEE